MQSPVPPSITCPRCKNNLPAWAQQCQFCGAPLQGVVRPVPQAIMDTWNNNPTWQEVGYIIVSILVILNGAYDLLQGFNIIPSIASKVGDGIFVKMMGTISCVLGIGMLFQQLWAQFLMKWCAVLMLVCSLWGIVISMTAISIVGYWPMVINIGYSVFFGFTIYIIREVGDVDP